MLVAVMAVGLGSLEAQSMQGGAAADSAVKPLLLERNDGELRTRRIRTDNKPVPAHQFMLKVSPKNNGSQHLVLGRKNSLQEPPYRSTDTWIKMKYC
jgi:hypothetical protein